jgi:uncharacterized protein (DUF2336 family)
MTDQRATLIDELESAAACGDLARRAETLRHVADLFIQGSGTFSEEHLHLFDDVMQRLIDKVEISARALLSVRLASISDAPSNTVRALAQDESIAVAGPVLSTSERLDTKDLVYGASNHSQSHLLAISGRKQLNSEITDVLLERGDQQVVRGTVGNSGAEFSEFGYSAMVHKAQHDENLAISVWCRPDIPRRSLIQLFRDSSAAVQSLFEAQDPKKSHLIRAAVAKASSKLMMESRTTSAFHAEAASNVQRLFADGKLDEKHLVLFAMSGDFDGTSVALSLLANLPIDLIERVFVQSRIEQLLVILKALDVSWTTARAVILLISGPSPVARDETEHAFVTFSRLQPKTAKTAIRFYRLREQATAN